VSVDLIHAFLLIACIDSTLVARAMGLTTLVFDHGLGPVPIIELDFESELDRVVEFQ
jgi:hypothetical protein